MAEHDELDTTADAPAGIAEEDTPEAALQVETVPEAEAAPAAAAASEEAPREESA